MDENGLNITDFVVYDVRDGRVLRSGRGSVQHASAQATGEHEAVLIDAPCMGAAWVDCSGAAPRLVPLGLPPSPWHQIDWTTREWIDTRTYAEHRAAAYPPLGEFADAWVHMQAGNSAPMQTYVSACQQVKADHPKPDSTGAVND